MASTGDTNAIKDYVASLGGQINKYPDLPALTDNQGLNAALIKCAHLCMQNGITFTQSINAPVAAISSPDIGVLFDNLLRNAVEACRQINNGQRSIHLEIWHINGRIQCAISNTIASSVLEGNPYLKTTKTDKAAHGYGMGSIAQIVKKYNGYHKVYEEGLVFVHDIYLIIPTALQGKEH